jgi:hypothetical protein
MGVFGECSRAGPGQKLGRLGEPGSCGSDVHGLRGAPAGEGSWARCFCLLRAGRVPRGTLQTPEDSPSQPEAPRVRHRKLTPHTSLKEQ